MHVQSLGYWTDLALLRLGGSEVEDRGDHQIVRTPDNPTFWWGNFVLLAGAPRPGRVGHWLNTFQAAFPGAGHVAIGIDQAPSEPDLSEFGAAGLTPERSAVLTARAVAAPPHRHPEAEYRPLHSQADWAQALDLRMACHDTPEPLDAYRVFVRRRLAEHRRLAGAGHGAWLGAFVDGQMVAGLGLYACGAHPQHGRLARFQTVETHPAWRRRGLCGGLVHHAAAWGLGRLPAHTLVMVADPDDAAIRVYRRVGFEDAESQLGLARPPA